MSDPTDGPSRLYKYFRPASIERVLAGRTLRFTQAKHFNDPFELFPTMDTYVRPLMSALLLEQARTDHRQQMRAAIQELIPKETFRLGLEQFLEEQLEDEQSDIVSEMRNAVSSAISAMTTEDRRAFLASMRERLNESYGVLSLSAVPDSILMWSHYADSHKGFVLELDTSDRFFDQRVFPTDLLRCVRKVDYQSERPPRGLFEPRFWLRSNKTATTDLMEYMAGVLLLTKSSDWTYEQEWRMIVPLARARNPSAEVYVLDLPARCVSRVIIGSAMSATDLKRIFEILEHPDFYHVEVRRAVCDTQRFRVVLHDDESIVEKKLLQDVEQFPGDGVQQWIDRLRVSAPRFYSAQAALVAKEWIAIPPFDRSKQKKKTIELTEAGRKRLAERREAAKAWEESNKSDATRLIDKVAGAPPDRIDALVAEHFREILLRDPERVERQTIDPEILRHFADLADEDEDVRWKAARALRKEGDANIVEHLTAILDWHPYEELAWIHDPRQRSNVTREEIKEIESNAPHTYWLLRNREFWGSDELTRLAAYALAGIAARIDAGEAIDALIRALNEPDGDTRWCAAEALGHLASPRALPALERLEKSDREDTSFGIVADAARIAIRRVKEAQKRGRART